MTINQPEHTDETWTRPDHLRTGPTYPQHANHGTAYAYPAATHAQPAYPPGCPYPPQAQAAPVQQVVSLSNQDKPKVRHGLHLVLTILTGGLWAIVWIIDCVIKGK